MPDPLRILFAGSGAFGRPTLEALIQRHDVVCVYTQPDRPAGRGKKLTPTPIATFAQERGLDVLRTDNLNAERLPPADILVVIAFGQKISDAVTRHPRLGAINLHASLLPKYRGAAPIHHALINGETVVGNSVIRLARKMDAGAILGQSRLEVRPTETTGELHDRLAEDGAPLVLRVLDELAAGTAVEREQDQAQATLAPKLSRADAVIDFTRPAPEVAAKINGLSPWPGCHVRLLDADGKQLDRLTLLRARVAEFDYPAETVAHNGAALERVPPGRRGCPGPYGVAGRPAFVGAGDGSQAVEILEVQPQGTRPMPLPAYRNGKPWESGMRLEPEI